MPQSRYLAAESSELGRIVAHDLEESFGRRGATVIQDGAGLVVDAGEFCILVIPANRSAVHGYRAGLRHRPEVERTSGKRTHLLFSCGETPARIARRMPEDNLRLEREGSGGRVLFLSLEKLEQALRRLADTPFDEYPNARWEEWFGAWPEIGNDSMAMDRLCAAVLPDDTQVHHAAARLARVRSQVEQERLRKDIRKLEDALRQHNVTGPEAMRSLVYLMFMKLFEEKRESAELPNRFTTEGFRRYRASGGRTVHHLLEEIQADEEIRSAKILDGVKLSGRLTDGLIEDKVFRVLDRYHFRGTQMDALGAVFEAIARRAEKDTRIGQFFTPEPIVRFAVDVVKPEPAQVVLDPAAGTGRFLSFSLERMQAGGRAVPGERLLGTDTDEWIVTIARMNLYIHGVREPRIHAENGLFLGDAPVFGEPLRGTVDVCVTNPPLGAMSYRHYAGDLVRRYPGTFAGGSEWLQKRLPVLPGEHLEERQVREAEARVQRWEGRARRAAARGDAHEEARALRYVARARQACEEAAERLAAGRGTYQVRGDSAKGGALFLAAIRDYLKPVRDADEPREWRGGKLGIIVDEAILNTPEYAQTRRFIRRNYFLKAVFSFDRDAFWYQARTTAKTSLLYLIRKEAEGVGQDEPVFYAHVGGIGFTRTGKPDDTDLPRTLAGYEEFEKIVRGSYRLGRFDVRAARAAMERADLPPMAYVQWQEEVDAADGARLDFAAETSRQLRAALPDTFPVLGDFVAAAVRNPPEDPAGIYTFGTVDRNTGEVREARCSATEYAPADLRVIHEGDVVVSGIDLVNGASGYAYAEVDGLVVSKEFYTLALKPERRGEVDPRFLALLLQTQRAREMVSGRVTGTSNRTRVEDVGALLALPLPPFPTLVRQREIVREAERAREARREARASFTRALHAANDHWKAQCARPHFEATVEELALAGD